MIRRAVAAATLVAMMALPVAAQEPTLADLRTEVSDLRSQLQDLRAELRAAGSEGYQQVGGAAAIDRMNAMEEQLTKLTNQTEQLQNRIRQVLDENTRRIDDVEFRLCEMDETCDLGALTTPDPVEANSGVTVVPQIESGSAPAAGQNSTASTAERADFDAAHDALNNGDFQRAAEMFAAVAEKHAGGPLTAEALYLRGAALDNAGQPQAAAAAWLEGFTADPNSARAGDSLLGIARVIENDGDPVAACLYLAEIPARFPDSAPAIEAESRMVALDCGNNGPASGETAEMDPEAAADLAEHE
ncbi:tetratricopeptide repeat protein [Paracoccus saliphilus]|uniref:Cell division coordinator CpoB n=2 Tax=Paracoccus saliphilus TaxID=405559 RepID=A0AA45W6D8_9RHOB|nr:tetratricopeptide repeat protein [Paracoccus saliphilus]SIT01297.1 tol-pal system protein YbgF [Paracoccus saliphilus]